MKILIITGFLGAGKTRFIKRMSEVLKRDFVIVENEFSKIDVDSKKLKSENKDMKIFELSEGCICCSLNLDFTESLLTIKNTLNPDYLVVEPSGIAMPTQIIAKLKNILYDDIKLISPIAIIDANVYKNQQQEFEIYFKDQLHASRNVIISKSEHLNFDDFLRIKEELNIKEDKRFFFKHYDNFSKDEFLELLNEELDLDHSNNFKYRKIEPKKEEELQNISFEKTKFIHLAQVVKLLEDTIRGRFGKIIRAKGFINLKKECVQFDLVDKNYAIKGAKDQKTGFVFIGKNLDKEGLREIVM